MSSKTTHEIRSHRSKRSYKPINKAMRHADARRRKEVRNFIGSVGSGMSFMDKFFAKGAMV